MLRNTNPMSKGYHHKTRLLVTCQLSCPKKTKTKLSQFGTENKFHMHYFYSFSYLFIYQVVKIRQDHFILRYSLRAPDFVKKMWETPPESTCLTTRLTTKLSRKVLDLQNQQLDLRKNSTKLSYVEFSQQDGDYFTFQLKISNHDF